MVYVNIIVAIKLRVQYILKERVFYLKIKKFLSGIVAGALAISTLAGVSSFSASADIEPETPLLPALNGLIKYQLRNSAEGTGKDIRFLAVVKQSDV